MFGEQGNPNFNMMPSCSKSAWHSDSDFVNGFLYKNGTGCQTHYSNIGFPLGPYYKSNSDLYQVECCDSHPESTVCVMRYSRGVTCLWCWGIGEFSWVVSHWQGISGLNFDDAKTNHECVNFQVELHSQSCQAWCVDMSLSMFYSVKCLFILVNDLRLT